MPVDKRFWLIADILDAELLSDCKAAIAPVFVLIELTTATLLGNRLQDAK